MKIDHAKDNLRPFMESAVKTGQFTLASGKTSDIYFDGKQVTLSQKGSYLLAHTILEVAEEVGATAVGGLSTGADPMVSALGIAAFEAGLLLKLFYVRKEPKSHGLQRWIEGPPLDKEDRVLILEDVITTGGSVAKAIAAVRQEVGAEVLQVMALLDREEGGTEMLREQEGLEVVSIFTKRDFL